MLPSLFNTLVTIDEDLEVVPDLAESWEVKDDGKTYLFHLHKGVKFHDGTDLDAAAVKWNFERLMEVYPYDPHKAKALLKEAGYGPDNPLRFTMVSPTIEPAFTDVPTLMKEQLARIGVEMKIEMLDKVTWMDRFIRKDDFQLTFGNLTGVTIGACAPYFETTSAINFANQTDELLKRRRTTVDPAEHARLPEEIQRYLADTLYLVGFANTPFFHAGREHVKRYWFVDKLLLNFEAAWLAR